MYFQQYQITAFVCNYHEPIYFVANSQAQKALITATLVLPTMSMSSAKPNNCTNLEKNVFGTCITS